MPHGFVVALRSFETARTQWHLISACSISRVVGRRYLGDQLGVASGVRMSEMNKSTRLVFHIGGYELRSPMSAHRRFIQELRRFEKTWSVQATPSEVPTVDQDRATWKVIASGPNWRVETEYRLVRWDDVIDASTRTQLWRRTLDGVHAFVDFVTAGALLGYLRSNWRYAGFFLYPFFLLALLAGIAGMFGASVGRISGTAPLGAVAGAAALAGLMQWPGRRLHLPILFDDWSFSRAYIKSPHPVLDPRLDRLARELVASARRGEAQEIVLVGHSLGAVLAVDLLDRALLLWPQLGRSGTRMIFVSVGSSILKIGLHQGASRFRAALQRVAAAPGVVWGEYQALTDVMNFYKTNPISSLGLKGTSPVVRLVRIRRMLDPSTYRHIRRNFFRVHCQFVRANDCRTSYDYFMFLCGPLSAVAQIHSPLGATLVIGSDGRLLDTPDAAAPFVQHPAREVI